MSRHSTRTCDSCGKRVGADARWYAYRPVALSHGPWLLERLCEPCKAWYVSIGHWHIRTTYQQRRLDLTGMTPGVRLA